MMERRLRPRVFCIIETEAPYKTGKTISLKMNVRGNSAGLEYKFVWQRDNWEDWGVIQSFGNDNTAKYVPTEEGEYTFVADIRDRSGKVLHAQATCRVERGEWKFVSIETDKSSPQSLQNTEV